MTDVTLAHALPHDLVSQVRSERRRWLVTGAAGFIGSNLVEALLALDQEVVGLDNFATGHQRNLDDVRTCVSHEQWARFKMIRGDIVDVDCCASAIKGCDIVLHQAALGSVPRSIADPIATNRANIDGTLSVFVAARDAKVRRLVYAASSSTYGDHPALPKVEEHIGRPLSPYAVTKYVNELYAGVFARTYGTPIIGLRYFNVFGPRQDPFGAYAAVIPRWVGELLAGSQPKINGDGETSRDFCFVANAVQANLRAALTTNDSAIGEVFNVAVGQRTTLNEVFARIRDGLAEHLHRPDLRDVAPAHGDFRAGDVRHSLADVSKAGRLLGYQPTHTVAEGLNAALPWYVDHLPTMTGK